MNRYLILLFLICCNASYGQVIKGKLFNADSQEAIEYVNIGIVGKNTGTVTGLNGGFTLLVDSIYNNDSILFSTIGYESRLIKVSDLRKRNNNIILLKEKTYKLVEVRIRPKILQRKTLGVVPKSNKINAGFGNNKLGYECGILMKTKKTAHLKSININISTCSYDTIHYRLNIYKKNGRREFENILKEPIYIEMPKESVKDEISINLESKEITTESDFLVTLEHIKDLGNGKLHFRAKLKNRTYYRKTSQGEWEMAPIGIGISVIADIEK